MHTHATPDGHHARFAELYFADFHGLNASQSSTGNTLDAHGGYLAEIGGTGP